MYIDIATDQSSRSNSCSQISEHILDYPLLDAFCVLFLEPCFLLRLPSSQGFHLLSSLSRLFIAYSTENAFLYQLVPIRFFRFRYESLTDLSLRHCSKFCLKFAVTLHQPRH